MAVTVARSARCMGVREGPMSPCTARSTYALGGHRSRRVVRFEEAVTIHEFEADGPLNCVRVPGLAARLASLFLYLLLGYLAKLIENPALLVLAVICGVVGAGTTCVELSRHNSASRLGNTAGASQLGVCSAGCSGHSRACAGRQEVGQAVGLWRHGQD